MPRRPRFLLRALAALALLAGAATAQAADPRLDEIEKKLDAALAEIERLRMGAVADTAAAAAPASRHGFAPAASKVYAARGGLSIGGYGEVLFQAYDAEREDGARSGRRSQADLLRTVFYIGHKFSDDLVFNSELEWEHVGIFDEAEVEVDPDTGEGEAELTGEAIVEFAYLDWLARPSFGVRAGKLLVPVGLVNEWHEPPVFAGAKRPDVERNLVPSTWAANGAGVFGSVGEAFAYRLYLMEGLDARGFSPSSGVRGGRQHGTRSLFTKPAVAARADWSGSGATLGASFYGGGANQSGLAANPRVAIYDLHARAQWQGLDVRALWVGGTLSDAGGLSDALGLAGTSRLGERFAGGYAEASFDVAPRLWPGTRWGLQPYARLEAYDTQDSVPGGAENPANARTVITAGVAVRPHPGVVLKLDRQQRSNDAETETSEWGLALGWLF